MKKYIKSQYSKLVDKVKSITSAFKSFFEKARKIVLSYAFKFVIIIITLLVIIWVSKVIWKNPAIQKMFAVSPATFTFETPNWTTDKFINKIKNIPGLKKRYNIFEKDLTKNIAELYAKNPLISKVCYVERRLPNKLNLKLELRRPIAIVKRKSRISLIDKDGARLPNEFYQYPEKGQGPLYIIYNRSLKIPKVGKKWNNEAINEGIKLLNFLKLNKIDDLLEIESIDVTNVGRKYRSSKNIINLKIKDGPSIKWGRPKSDKYPNELSNEEKLQNLLSVVKEEGAAIANMKYIDVRWKIPIGKR